MSLKFVRAVVFMLQKKLERLICKVANMFNIAFRKLLLFSLAFTLKINATCIYVVHGMGSNPYAVKNFAQRLIDDGYVVPSHARICDYSGSPIEAAKMVDRIAAMPFSVSDMLLYYDSKTETIEEAAEKFYKHLFIDNSVSDDVVLIGHSMGGLVVRYMAEVLNKKYRKVHITKVITIGTPNNGVELVENARSNKSLEQICSLVFGEAAFFEVSPYSNFMYKLNADGLDANISYLAVAGNYKPVFGIAKTLLVIVDAINNDRLNINQFDMVKQAVEQFGHYSIMYFLLDKPNDGVVPCSNVDIRRLGNFGYDDRFVVVDYCNHSDLMNDSRVIDIVERFLAN